MTRKSDRSSAAEDPEIGTSAKSATATNVDLRGVRYSALGAEPAFARSAKMGMCFDGMQSLHVGISLGIQSLSAR